MKKNQLPSRPSGGRLPGRLLYLLLLFFSLSSQAQTSNPDSVAITGNQNWQLIKTTSELKIYSKEADCNDAANGFFTKEVWLKMENLTGNSITVTWNKRLYYDNVCHRCNSTDGESGGSVTLAPYETITGTCGSKLSMFIRMASGDGQAMTSFELRNLTVN